MYCGSCLRDNALAAELIAQGHDVTLLPLYTPILTDEENVSHPKVFFGGISVYLEQHLSLFRKTPRLLDRVWDSNFALRLAARRSIPTNPDLLTELTVSTLKGEDGFQAKEISKLLRWLKDQPLPDIVSLPNSLLIALAKPIKQALNRPICCTLQGEDLFLGGMREPYRTEALRLIRSQVEYVDAFIPVSHYYADFVTKYFGIPVTKIFAVPLGINLQGYEPFASQSSDVFRIGFFARVAPEKGLDVLCDAYRLLRKRDDFPKSRLDVAGYLAPEHKPYLEQLQQQMTEWGYRDDFAYHGVLDRKQKIDFLLGLDVLSVPATYDEPKGLFVLEAMACGVPVVQPRRGAFTEMIQQTNGGVLVDPDNPESLADGIHSLAKNRAFAQELGRNGRAGVEAAFTVKMMAERTVDVYSTLLGQKQEKEFARCSK